MEREFSAENASLEGVQASILLYSRISTLPPSLLTPRRKQVPAWGAYEFRFMNFRYLSWLVLM